MSDVALVLSGGNALGAYHSGIWRVLERQGVEPEWIAGTSIGAVTACIIAGNAPGERAQALDAFWARAEAFDGGVSMWPRSVQAPFQYAQALASRIAGRGTLFTSRLPDLTGERPGMFDPSPMRRLIGELVDFDRLNDGPIRVSILALDLENGEEVVFDSRRERLRVDHVMASAAFIPDFPPVEIDGRLLVDGGLSANLPVHLVLQDMLECPAVCFAADLFPSSTRNPKGILQAAQRQTDLIFASQSKRTLRHLQERFADRAPGTSVFHIVYNAPEGETALKGFDFSSSTLARRVAAGEHDSAHHLERWRTTERPERGITVHGPPEA